eukprot:9480247-Pyramimonas_sp.AAC.1
MCFAPTSPMHRGRRRCIADASAMNRRCGRDPATPSTRTPSTRTPLGMPPYMARRLPALTFQ